MLNLTRRLIALRRDHPALRTGGMTMTAAAEGLLTFQRDAGAEALLCVFNLGHAPIDWSIPEGWSVVEAVNTPDPASGALPPLTGLLLAKVG